MYTKYCSIVISITEGNLQNLSKMSIPARNFELRAIFVQADQNYDGEIHTGEISQVCKDFGVEPTFADIKYLLNMLDLKYNNKITFKEFYRFCKLLNIISMSRGENRNVTKEEELRMWFIAADMNESGKLTKYELQMALKQGGQELKESELEALIKHLDVNKDKKISVSEFLILAGSPVDEKVPYFNVIPQLEAEMKSNFSKYDENYNGELNLAEVSEIWERLGAKPTSSELQFMFDLLKLSKDEKIKLRDFTKLSKLLSELIRIRAEERDPTEKEKLKMAFIVVDTNETGNISAAELRRVMIDTGSNMTISQLQPILDRLEINKDGNLRYEDFLKHFEKCY